VCKRRNFENKGSLYGWSVNGSRKLPLQRIKEGQASHQDSNQGKGFHKQNVLFLEGVGCLQREQCVHHSLYSKVEEGTSTNVKEGSIEREWGK
jgi:hypothetical protein